jgi:hypothetical protein
MNRITPICLWQFMLFDDEFLLNCPAMNRITPIGLRQFVLWVTFLQQSLLVSILLEGCPQFQLTVK